MARSWGKSLSGSRIERERGGLKLGAAVFFRGDTLIPSATN